MVTLLKTEYVLDKVRDGGGRNVYVTRKPDEPDEDIVFMVMPRDQWLDMGSPDTITLSIQPGDRLNDQMDSRKIEFGPEVEKWLGDAFVSWLPSTRGILFLDYDGEEVRAPFGATIYKNELGYYW